MEINEVGILNISEYIRTGAKMHVTLYCNKCPVPLLSWFRKGTNLCTQWYYTA